MSVAYLANDACTLEPLGKRLLADYSSLNLRFVTYRMLRESMVVGFFFLCMNFSVETLCNKVQEPKPSESPQ
jgi:hypothetical protein